MKLQREYSTSVLILLAVVLAAFNLVSCGGGGGSTPPADNPPDPVEEITDTDLTDAGIPLPPFGTTSAVRSASLCNNEVITGWDEALDTHNLEPLPAGGGYLVTAPEGTRNRILAWAMYKVEGGTGHFLREMSFNIGMPPTARVFYAVGNFTRGRWEIGGRIFSYGFESGNAVAFSNGQRYSGPSGDAYLLIVVGHPGGENVDAFSLNFEEIRWMFADRQCLQDGFGDEQQYSVMLGDGSVRFFGEGFPIEQRFPDGGGNYTGLLLPAVQALFATEGEPHHFFDITYAELDQVQLGSDLLFYDPTEINAGRHPFALRVMVDGQPQRISACSLMDTGGTGTANGIIGILVALNHVVPGATVKFTSLSDGTSNTVMTDKRGGFSFDISGFPDFEGELTASWESGGEQQQWSAHVKRLDGGDGPDFINWDNIELSGGG